MSEQIILSADDFRALGGDPSSPAPIPTGPHTAILPIALTGQYEGKFALAPTVKATEAQAAILARLPRLPVADSERKWVVDAEALLQASIKNGGVK